jgi:hypothetical protein
MPLQHDLLAGHLGVHVRDAVGPHGVALVDVPGDIKPERDDRGDVHEALSAGSDRGIERGSGAHHVDPPKAMRVVVHPEPGRGVNHKLRPSRRLLPRAALGQIPRDDPQLGLRADVDARDLGPRLAVAPREPPPDQAQRAGDEDALRNRGLGRRRGHALR